MERSIARMESPLLQPLPDPYSNVNLLFMRLPHYCGLRGLSTAWYGLLAVGSCALRDLGAHACGYTALRTPDSASSLSLTA